MALFKQIIFCILCELLIFNSCSGREVVRMKYEQYVLCFDSIPELPLRNSCWKTVRFKDFLQNPLVVSHKTILLIDEDCVVSNLILPHNAELHFCGGSLKGNLHFDNNYLSGKIRLHGCKLGGTIKNESFEAGWICYGDGQNDDAKGINQALNVCNNIHFQKGSYLVKTMHNPNPLLSEGFIEAINSHIGVYRSGVTLIGDNGASILCKDKNKVITIYSLPYQIENSISNITVKGLVFRVENDGENFNELIHTIKILGVNGLSVLDCQFFDYWGDAICLSHYGDNQNTGERTCNRNVTISGNYIDGLSHNNRNGISVISGKNVIINNNTLVETSKNDMPGAIDIEANNRAYTVDNIKIKNNIIYGCKGGVGSIGIVSNEKEAPANHITISNNTIYKSEIGIGIIINSRNATSFFVIADNVMQECKSPIVFGGAGQSKNWTFKGNEYNKVLKPKIGGNIQVKNLKTD